MLNVTSSITGIPEVVAELRKLRMDALAQEVGDILDEMARDAADYPPPPADSTYIRTGTLGRGWTDGSPLFDTDATSLLAVLTNSTPYGPFVQGAEDQAWMHVGRWRTTDALHDAWEPRVAQRVEDAIGRLVGV